MRAALGSHNASLLEPLFKPGWGLDLRVVDPSQVSSSSSQEEQDKGGELCPPLPELVVQQGGQCMQELLISSLAVGRELPVVAEDGAQLGPPLL